MVTHEHEFIAILEQVLSGKRHLCDDAQRAIARWTACLEASGVLNNPSAKSTWSSVDYQLGNQSYKDVHVPNAGALFAQFLSASASTARLDPTIDHYLTQATLRLTLRCDNGTPSGIEQAVIGIGENTVIIDYSPSSDTIDRMSFRSRHGQLDYQRR
jgi:hypothetical protein